MLRKYALTVVFLFVVCGAAAQLPDDEYYPYGTGYEQRTPIVLTDSSLFYRAIQTMPDLYGSISAFNLPYIALGRRGQHYSSEAASFSGLGISSRYFGSLRLLGAREERRAGIAALPEAIGGAGGVRTFCFAGALAEPSYHASVRFHRPQLPGRGETRLCAACGPRLGCRCRRRGPHGARHARRRRLHECPDGGIPCRQAFGRGPYAGIPPHCPAVGTGHTPFFGRRGFPPYGRQPLQSGLGFPGRQSPQFARAARVRAAGRRYVLRAAVAATWLDMAAGAEYGVRKYSALGWYDARTPMPDNYRYLPGYTATGKPNWHGGRTTRAIRRFAGTS